MARKAKVVAPVIIEEVLEVVEQVEEAEQEASLGGFGELVANLVEAVEHEVEEIEAKPLVSKEKNAGVGVMVKQLIGEGLTNKEILVELEEMYGNKQTTYACVAWYRNKMKKTGLVVKTKASLDWVQEFAKREGLSEEAVSELLLKVA